MVAPRLLFAVAALVRLFSFCSWTSKIVLEWLHESCDKNLSADFLQFGADEFPSKNAFKIFFVSLRRRDPVLELQFPTPLRVVLLCFATQSLQIALYLLLHGCYVLWLHRNTIVFCSWNLKNRIEWMHEGCVINLLADFPIVALVFFVASRIRAV